MHRLWNDKAKNTETSGNSPHQPDHLHGHAQTNIFYSYGVKSLIEVNYSVFFLWFKLFLC